MEQNNEIEMQLWEYINGTCNEADRQRISLLITTDVVWSEKYRELTALHDRIAGSLEVVEPSMRFTKNVMDAVTAKHIAPATGKYINKGIIRGIAAFFILMIVSALGYALVNARWNTGSGGFLPKLNLGGISSNGFLNLMICVNIILGLAFIDILLRKKRLHRSN